MPKQFTSYPTLTGSNTPFIRLYGVKDYWGQLPLKARLVQQTISWNEETPH